jgi:hypothetical protein
MSAEDKKKIEGNSILLTSFRLKERRRREG